jgi:hypothetical protein
MKPIWQSKTFWVGALAVFVSIATVILEFWAMLGHEEMLVIRDLIGPEAVGVLGLVMIALRVVTTTAVTLRNKED